jgi:hypothetical protein
MTKSLIEVEGYCRLWGKAFFPSKIEEKIGICFDRKNDPGELGKIGRYRGTSIPFGSAAIKFSENGDSNDLISKDAPILDTLERYRTVFREAGVTDITLHVNIFYKKQCNIEQSHELLKRLSMLEVNLAISCQQVDEF